MYVDIILGAAQTHEQTVNYQTSNCGNHKQAHHLVRIYMRSLYKVFKRSLSQTNVCGFSLVLVVSRDFRIRLSGLRVERNVYCRYIQRRRSHRVHVIRKQNSGSGRHCVTMWFLLLDKTKRD